MAALLVLTGCVASSAASPGPVIDVDGHLVRANGAITVADALRRADVVVPAGAVLSARTRRPLPGNHQPGEVLLDGQPVTTDTLVRPGAVLTVVPGEDVTEPVRVVTEPVPPSAGSATLFVGGRPGRAEVVQGVLSGETVSRRLLVRPRHGRLIAPRAIALTFDDGPDPRWTPKVLWLLSKWHVHATFCLVGRHVVAHPELVRAIVARGHALCNHTWSHDEGLGRRSPEVIRGEIARTQQAIFAAAGVMPRFFRAPGGAWTSSLLAEVRRQGLTPLRWDVDPRDWMRPGSKRIVSRVLSRARPGDVVLMHDGYGDRAQSVEALRVLLARLRQLHDVLVLPQV